MVSQTGIAILKIDDNGNKFWSTFDCDVSKDAMYLKPGEHIKFNPEGFEAGTEIRIYEPI